MVKIKFGEDIYELPTTWSEVKIFHYQEIKKLDYAELGKLKYIIKVVQVFTGLPEQAIINAPASALTKIYEVISFIYTEPMTNEITNKFLIGDDVYTLKEFSDLTTGERISLEVLLENEIDDVFPEIMAILFQKNDESFNASTMNEIADDIATEVGIGQLYGVLLFFCEIEKTFLVNIQNYLVMQKETQKLEKMTKTKRMIYKTKKKMKQMSDYIGKSLSTHWQKGDGWMKRRFIKQTS